MITGVKDLDIKILIELSYEKLSELSSLFELCKSPILWRNKIKKDFPLRSKFYYTEYLNLYKNNPHKLYKIINQNSKMIYLSENDYPELEEVIDGEPNEEYLTLINQSLARNLDILPMLRGDVVHLTWLGYYENIGRFLWDGEKAVDLDTNLDLYGSVPKEFSFPEFPIDYFYDTINHNNIIWLSSQVIQEIIRNFDENTQISHVYNYQVVAGTTDILTVSQFASYVADHPYSSEEVVEESEFLIILGCKK